MCAVSRRSEPACPEFDHNRGVTGAPHVIAGEISERCPTFAATRDPSGRLVVTPTPWADDVLRACFGAR